MFVDFFRIGIPIGQNEDKSCMDYSMGTHFELHGILRSVTLVLLLFKIPNDLARISY